MIGLEAVAAGTPLVTPPFPAFGDIETPGVVIARSRNAESLAHAIHKALDTRSFRFPREWRASVAGARLTDLYASVLAA